jgi:hypothetical protein
MSLSAMVERTLNTEHATAFLEQPARPEYDAPAAKGFFRSA